MLRGGETNGGGGWVAVVGVGVGDGEGAGGGRPVAEEEGAEERGLRRYGLMGRDGACDGGTVVGWRRYGLVGKDAGGGFHTHVQLVTSIVLALTV